MEKQLKPMKNGIDNANANALEKIRVLNKLSTVAKETLDEIKELDKKIDYTNLICVHTNGKTFDFSIF